MKIKKKWLEVEKPIATFRLEHKNKNILFFYRAEWCLVCKQTEKTLFSKEIQNYLAKNKILLAVVDCTNQDSIGTKELKKRDSNKSVPAFTLIDKDGNVTHLDEASGLSKKSFIKSVDHAVKKAEQDRADRPLTAP